MRRHDHLLPRWVAEEAIESGIVPQEHLGKRSREVNGLEHSNCLAHTIGLALSDEGCLIELLRQWADAGAVCGHEIE